MQLISLELSIWGIPVQMREVHLYIWGTFVGPGNNSSPSCFLPSDTSTFQSPHAAWSHYQCGDNYPPNIGTNWLFIKAGAPFSLGPLLPGMRRSSCVAVLVLIPLATALPLHPDDHTDSTPHPLLPPRIRRGYSTFRVRPRILKGLPECFSEVKSRYDQNSCLFVYIASQNSKKQKYSGMLYSKIKTLPDSDKKLLEKTKRILSSLGSYLKMELTNVDHKIKVIIKNTSKSKLAGIYVHLGHKILHQ